MDFRSTKEKFMHNIIVRSTLDGSLQRSYIYAEMCDEKDKKQFRNALAFELTQTLQMIIEKKNYSDSDHYDAIENFSARISEKNSWLLKDNFKEPIHCPFDRLVIQRLDKKVRKLCWTKMNTIDEYKLIVEAAKVEAAGNSLANWELKIYGNIVNYE